MTAIRKIYSLISQLLDNYKEYMEQVRVRKVDVDKLSDVELEKLQKAISDKVIKIINKANEDANKILSVYGMETQMIMEIKEKE